MHHAQRQLLIWTGGNDGLIETVVGSVHGVRVTAARDRDGALAAMPDADAVITADHAWDAELAAALRRAGRVRFVQLLTAGFDRLERHGVPRRAVVSTIGGEGAELVAEHALFLLLNLLRQGPAIASAQARGEWAFAAMAQRIESLRGKRLVVLGFGHVGRAIARLARAFGASVTGVARSPRRDASGCEVVPLAELAAVLPGCDALIVALPLNPDTHGLLDETAFARIKEGARLVNVARGRIVVTEALLGALESGRLAGAALDVTDPEPLPAEHPLWSKPNVVITPHVAWAGGGTQARRVIARCVAENVRRFVEGEPPRNVAPIVYLEEACE